MAPRSCLGEPTRSQSCVPSAILSGGVVQADLVTLVPVHRPAALTLGPMLGKGSFGSVRLGHLDDSPVVVKTAFSVPRAEAYLDLEEYFNRRLCLEGIQFRSA